MASEDASVDTSKLIPKAHELLASVAKTQNARTSKLVNDSVSRHELPSSVSFQNLAILHAAVKESNKLVPQYDFVASVGTSIVFSSKFGFALTSHDAPMIEKSRKRKRTLRDEQEDRAIESRKRLEKLVGDAIPKTELDVAQNVLVDVLTELRGPSSELVVQSFALLSKKLQSSDDRPKVVLALRLNAGVPIPLVRLKQLLGPCWTDGVVSTDETVQGVSDRELPLSDEGKAAQELGNAPLLLVTSVPCV